MIKFVIDTYRLNTKYKNSAVSNYANKIVECLKKQGVKIFELNGIVKNRELNKFIYRLFYRLWVKLKNKEAIFILPYNPDFLIPYFNYIVFYDLIPIQSQGNFLKRMYYYYAYLVNFLFAKKVITFSNVVRNEVIKIFPFKGKIGKKIYIVPPFIEEAFFEPINLKKIRPHILNLKDSMFILAFGTGEPRKNIERVFQFIKNTNLTNKRLVLFGNNWNGVGYNNVKKLQIKYRINNILHLGRISTEELKFLMSKCEFFIYPSKAEGIGLPPIEALSCGAKVIASDIPVHREFLKDFAFYIPLHNDITKDNEILKKVENTTIDKETQIKFCKENYRFDIFCNKFWKILKS